MDIMQIVIIGIVISFFIILIFEYIRYKNSIRIEDNKSYSTKIKHILGIGFCVICNRKLHDNIYTVSGDLSYYCKKHALEEEEKRISDDDEPDTKNKKNLISNIENTNPNNESIKDKVSINAYDVQKRNGITILKQKKTSNLNLEKERCDKCTKKIGGVDFFSCKYCGGNYCSRHRLPEDHNCGGNPKNPHSEGSTISYSKGKY